MYDVQGEGFSQKNFLMFNEVKIVFKMKTGLQMVSTPEMVDSVNALILAARSVTIKDISEQLRISVGSAHKIVHDNLF